MADMFTEAIAHLRADRLDLAANLLEAVLADNPSHADSLNLLGVLAHKQGDNEQAVKLIERAIELGAPRPPYFVNLSTAADSFTFWALKAGVSIWTVKTRFPLLSRDSRTG